MTTCTVSWAEGLVDGLTLLEAKELAAELIEKGCADVVVEELGARLEAATKQSGGSR